MSRIFFVICMAIFFSFASYGFTFKENRSMNNIIHLSAVLKCAPHQAFEMFTENKLLESWLANTAEVEPSIGGRYELFWEPGDRENNCTTGCRITALIQDKFLSFEWKSPEQFKHFANNADPLTHVVVFFIPVGNSTEVHLVHSGWRSSHEWEEARQWQEKAWIGAFNELQKKIGQQ